MNSDDDLVNPWLCDPKPANWQKFVYFSEGIDAQYEQADAVVLSPDATEHSCNGRVLPLCSVQVGDRVCVISVNCGKANTRLKEMGVSPGAMLEVIHSTSGGSVLVALQHGSGSVSSLEQLGLGARLACRIQVIEATESRKQYLQEDV